MKPIRDQNPQLEALFRDFLSAREVNLIPVTLPLREQAARLRGLGLKTPNALHAATALSQQCALFITNGPVFYRVPNLPIVVLADVLRTPA